LQRYHDRAHVLATDVTRRDPGNVVKRADGGALEGRGSGVDRVTFLLRTPELVLGEFHCPPDDDLWTTDNNIGDLSHVVWPLTTVEIRRSGFGTICADANTVVLYNPGTEYRRRRVAPSGDRSLFLALRPTLLERLPAAVVHAHGAGFAAGHVWCSAQAWLVKEGLVAAARSGRFDPMQLEEMALSATYDALGDSLPGGAAALARGRIRERIEEARMLLGQELDEPLHVTAIAKVLGVSPFHLARQFRDLTGTSMYAYRQDLRVRTAVQRIFDEPRCDLSAVAADQGFASHSHFTAACRRTFGVTPSALRARLPASGRRTGRG
jgi:AraC family transcriptional regulator